MSVRRSGIHRAARGRLAALGGVILCLAATFGIPASVAPIAAAPPTPVCQHGLLGDVAPTSTAECVTAETPQAIASLPGGFNESIVIGGLTNPTTAEFATDGRVFVGEKSGIIRVFDTLGDTTPTVFSELTTNVLNYWDRGLLGLALDPSLVDPSLPARPWVYVLYTFDHILTGSATPRWNDACPSPPGPTSDGCVASARLSRFSVSGTTISGPEQVLIEDWCQQFPSHSIGTLAFGGDGALYVSGGDGASFTTVDYGQFGGVSGSPPVTPVNPCVDPPGGTPAPPSAEGGALRSQDLRSGGDPTGLAGTILRVDPVTGAAFPGNPLLASSDPNARRIIAYGLRNPFRFAVRPGTDELWIGDVGWNSWEELNRIASASDGVVENFGWPCLEGTGRQAGYDAANLNLCESLYAAGTATAPAFSYNHGSTVVTGETCPIGSSSIAGMTFYPEAGGSFPAAYRGGLFFSDYTRDCIWFMPRGPNGQPDPAERQTFVAGAANPVDLTAGPGGDLFYVDFDGGTIRRISAPPPPPSGGTTSYLSDLAFSAIANGWGPIERDQSNGEQLAGDGSPITLAGVVYPKGLGVHAASEVRYAMTDCTSFTAQVGVDDEMGTFGSVAFEVWTDGTKRYNSGVMTNASPTASVTIDVTGRSQLVLIVTNGGDDIDYDHADWADAKLTCGSGPPPPDGTPPTVVSTAPLAGATGQPAATTPSATFSEPIDTATLSTATFTLIDLSTQSAVGGTVSWSAGSNRATFTPGASLTAGATYEARVRGGPGGIADLAGNRMASDMAWAFTVAAGPNAPPSASLIATPDHGQAPLTVSFDGRASTDPEHGALSFRWDLDGDLAFDNSTDATPVWTYTAPGDVIVGLEVTDPGGLTSRTTRVISIAPPNAPPVPVIEAPQVGTTWSVGDVIAFSGGAVDPEDGALPAASLDWSLTMWHCPSNCHPHVIGTESGVESGIMVAPDHDYPSYLELTLSTRDSSGASASITRRLDPKVAGLSFASVPAGLELTVGSSTQIAPFMRTVIDGSVNSLSAASPQDLGGIRYAFAGWSDGGPAGHDIVGRPGGSYTATYVPISTDIRVTKAATRVGPTVTFTINVANVAGSSAAAAAMIDTLASRLTYQSATTTQGTCGRSGRKVTCALGSLAPGQQVVIVITTRVDKLSGSVSNTATASTSTLELGTANNASTVTVRLR